jgi:hypothetical protein
MVVIVVLFAVMALCPITRVFSACDPEPVLIKEIPRLNAGWSGAVACYNGLVYITTGGVNYAEGRNPETGILEDTVIFGSWTGNNINGLTYDPFRGTFWLKVGDYAYEVPVTGGMWINRFNITNGRSGMAFGIWKDPDEENVMWVADPVQPQIRKTNMLDGSVSQYITTTFNVRGVSRVGDTFWCVRAGEPGQAGLVAQVNMSGTTICSFFLPVSSHDHDAGGCDIDSNGHLWIPSGTGADVVYEYDVGYAPTTPTPMTRSTPASPVIDSGDYDGDSTSDIAIFRAGSGLWAIRDVTRVYFGTTGDVPASGDFDGDGTTDLVIFRPSSGLWSAKGVTRAYFGGSSDTAVPGDYDADGSCEAAIYRPSSGLWAIQGVTRVYFGSSSDRPVPMYASGRTMPKNIGIFRPSSGLWAVRGFSRLYFGASGDEPVLGVSDSPAIFRASSGLWAIRDVTRVYFGGSSDQPIPGNYTGFVPADIGIFRASTGLWAVQGVTRAYFGTSGDIPVSGLSINPSSAVGM